MSLKDLSDETLREQREIVARAATSSERLLSLERKNLEAIDAELKRREQKPVLLMKILVEPLSGHHSIFANDVRVCGVFNKDYSNIDPAALARKISVVEMMWALERWRDGYRSWQLYMRDKYGVDVSPPPSAEHARKYVRAVVEGREPTAEEKAAWGIVE